MSMHRQRGIVGRLRDLVNGIFAVWMREREAERPDAVYERVIGERVRQYAELKRAVAGILYMRNKIEGELRERRSELARLHEDIGLAVRQNDDEVALVLITQKDGLLQDLERGQRELEEVSAECEGAKANLVKFRPRSATWSARRCACSRSSRTRAPAAASSPPSRASRPRAR